MLTCDEKERNCKTEGMLTDAFDILAEMFNFTLRIDYIDDWGVIPKVALINDIIRS